MNVDSPHSVRGSDRANINNVRVELGGVTLVLVVLLMGIIASCGIVMGLNLSRQDQMDADFKTLKTQEWLVERRLMDDEAYRIVNGQKLQSDNEYGPTGNLQRMKPGVSNGRK